MRKKKEVTTTYLPTLPTNDSAIRRYITIQSSQLSHEEVLWIFRKHPSKRTKKDNDDLINSNLPLVYSIAQKFYQKNKKYNNGVLLADLFQAGVIGLSKAIGKYDSMRGIKFSTYAWSWISASIRSEIRSITHPMMTYSYAPVAYHYIDDSATNNTNNQDTTTSTNAYTDLLDDIGHILTDEELDLFTLYFLEEYTLEQIGKKINLSISAVHVRILKIRQILKDNIKR